MKTQTPDANASGVFCMCKSPGFPPCTAVANGMSLENWSFCFWANKRTTRGDGWSFYPSPARGAWFDRKRQSRSGTVNLITGSIPESRIFDNLWKVKKHRPRSLRGLPGGRGRLLKKRSVMGRSRAHLPEMAISVNRMSGET